LGYAAHCWELFGLRGWFVAFLAFASGTHGRSPAQSAMIVGALSLLGPMASILGNEVASRIGHLRWIRATMVASALLALAVGSSVSLPFTVLLGLASVYFLVVMADSASLTAGLVEVAGATQRGTMIGIYSLFGFGAGFAAPLVFGLMLDLAGGGDVPNAWGFAFGTLAIAGLLWLGASYALMREPIPARGRQ
jgi:MFS family permease